MITEEMEHIRHTIDYTRINKRLLTQVDNYIELVPRYKIVLLMRKADP